MGSSSNKDSDAKYQMPPAPAEDWKGVPMEGGLSYIFVADPGDDDVVTLFATSEDSEVKITSEGVLADYIKSKGYQGLKAVETTTFRGVPGVRYEIYKRDTGMGGTQEMRDQLGLYPREPGVPFFVRTEVFAYPEPDNKHKVVNLGISRMSSHGYIGTTFENVRNQFVSDFLEMNNIPGYRGDEEYGIVEEDHGFVEDGYEY